MARNFVAASTQYLFNAGTPITSTPLTIAGWYKPTVSTAVRTLFSIALSSSNTVYWRLAYDEAAGVLDAEHRNGPLVEATQTGTTEGAWNHAAAVYASNSSRIAYVNGSAGTENTSSSSTPGVDRLAIGVLYRSGLLHYFDGDLAEFGLWDAALTADEIAALSKGLSPLLVRRSNLVSYWPLYGKASPEPDLVGGYSLTLNGTPAAAAHPRIIRRRPVLWRPNAAAAGAYTLTAASGSFTLTGQAATLTAQRLLTAAQASFALTGNAAGLTAQRLLTAALGSFVLTGNAATLTHGTAGAYSLVAATGSFALTGNAAGLTAQRLITAAHGAFTLTGNAAALAHGYMLSAAHGTFVITGNAAGLTAQRLLSAAHGSFALTGNAATVAHGYILAAAQASFALTGNAANLTAQRLLTADHGIFVLTGNASSLTYSNEPPPIVIARSRNSGVLSSSRRPAQLSSGRRAP